MPDQLSLPKFLLCDDGDDDDCRFFVLHCHFPRMLIEFAENVGRVVMSIDPDSAYISTELAEGREPGVGMARIMREAGDFFVEQMNKDADEF